MNDHQNTSMRALLAHAVPAHDEEPPAREVIGPAIAWGERRRRLDRVMVATGAAAAVVAISAGVATLGNGPRPGAAISPGGTGGPGSPWSPGRSYATTGGPQPCALPNGQPGSASFCALDAQVSGFGVSFADGVAGYVSATLPSGVTVERTGSYYLKLSKGGTTEYLYPSVESPDTLVGQKEQCGNSECSLVPVADGTAAVGPYSGATLVDWMPDSNTGPRITLILATTAPGQGMYFGGPPPAAPGLPSGQQTGRPTTKPVTLLTPQQLTAVVADPAFRQYTYQEYNILLQTRQLYLDKMASELPSIPGGYVSGSIPARGVAPGTVPSAPLGTPSGLVSPPEVPLGTMSPSGPTSPPLPTLSGPAGTGSMSLTTPGS